MRLTIGRNDLTRVLADVSRVIASRNTIPILSNVMLSANDGKLQVTGTDLDIIATASVDADISEPGTICVDAKLFGDIAKKAGGDVSIALEDGKLIVKSGRSRFSMATLSAEDFPTFGDSKYDAEFDLDIAALFAPVSFGISSEETRYYLCGVFFRGGAESVAVATDSHRLARNMGPELPEFNGIIVPSKLCGMLPKGAVHVSVSEQKIRLRTSDLIIVSKLIDGTFPDYDRVIPANNDRIVVVDRDAMMQAADRVVTISSERGRAVKMSVAPGGVTLSARSEVGTAEDEVAAEYTGEPFEIGFNSQYVRDMFAVLPSGPVTLALTDNGPGLVKGGLDGWTGVLMPMRV